MFAVWEVCVYVWWSWSVLVPQLSSSRSQLKAADDPVRLKMLWFYVIGSEATTLPQFMFLASLFQF